MAKNGATIHQNFQQDDVSCEKEKPWRFGSTISNYMRNVCMKKKIHDVTCFFNEFFFSFALNID